MEKFEHTSFGKRLKKARGKRTQAEVAQLAGVGQGTIAKYEKGMIPNANILKRIADCLGVSTEYLLTEKIETVGIVAEETSTYNFRHPDSEIQAVIEMMEAMDRDTKKDVRLSVEKEKLLRELLNQRDRQRAG